MAGTNEKTTQIVCVEAMDDLVGLFGVFDENLRVIEEETGTRITTTEEGPLHRGRRGDDRAHGNGA